MARFFSALATELGAEDEGWQASRDAVDALILAGDVGSDCDDDWDFIGGYNGIDFVP
jgi:hypothetical protein